MTSPVTTHLLKGRPTRENLAAFAADVEALSSDARDAALAAALPLQATFSRPCWTSAEVDVLLAHVIPLDKALALHQRHRFHRARFLSADIDRLFATGPRWAAYAAGAQKLSQDHLTKFLTTISNVWPWPVPDDILRAQVTSVSRLFSVIRSGLVADLSTTEWLALIMHHVTTLDELTELLPLLDANATAILLLRPRRAHYPPVPRALIEDTARRHPSLALTLLIFCSKGFLRQSLHPSPNVRVLAVVSRPIDDRRLLLHVPGLVPLLRSLPPTDVPLLAKFLSALLRRCPDPSAVLAFTTNPAVTLAQAFQTVSALERVA